MLMEFLNATWSVTLEVAPWLVLGLLLSGLVKIMVPDQLLQRFFGGPGIMPVVRAAILGTPLPLCSCSVLPAAIGLRRQGTSKGATVSFLVATPENGADSIALTYALLGPLMALIRPLAAICCAIAAGGLVTWMDGEPAVSGTTATPTPGDCCTTDTCCSSNGNGGPGNKGRFRSAIRFALVDVFDDIILWIIIGIGAAGLMNALLPPETLATWGSGLPAMLVIMALSIPAYICATASTPIAASFLAAGMSPGTVLVFLLAGPASNLGSIGVLRRELGLRTTLLYLAAVGFGAVVCGLLLDELAHQWGLAFGAGGHGGGEWMPQGVALASVVVLGVLTLGTIYRKMRKPEHAKSKD